MSGGSYDYICFASVEQLLSKQEQIQNMADRLAELGYANDAAKTTQELLMTLREFENRIDAMREDLISVWKGLEWWDSGDYNEETFKECLEEWRNK